MGNSATEDALRGNIEQRGDHRWRLRVFAGRENGRMKLVTRSFQGTKRQAGTALAKLVTEVEQGQVAKHHPGTLADLLDRWLETVAPERSPYTMKEYRRMATTSIKPAIGTVPLAKLTGARLDTFYRSLTDRGLSSGSVRRHHFLLHAALGRAVKWGMVPLNPADRSTPPGLSHSTVSAPDVADVQRLIRATETSQPIVAAAIALAAVTGARRGELCALRWSRRELGPPAPDDCSELDRDRRRGH